MRTTLPYGRANISASNLGVNFIDQALCRGKLELSPQFPDARTSIKHELRRCRRRNLDTMRGRRGNGQLNLSVSVLPACRSVSFTVALVLAGL